MVLMERFQLSMEILSTGVRGIIKMYCETFHVRYNPGERCDSVRGMIVYNHCQSGSYTSYGIYYVGVY